MLWYFIMSETVPCETRTSSTSSTNSITLLSKTSQKTRSSTCIIFRSVTHVHSEMTYEVCRTPCWLNKLYPFVKKELFHHSASETSQTTSRTKLLQKIVLSWFIGYKYKISLVRVVDNASGISFQLNDGARMSFWKKINIVVRDIDNFLKAQPDPEPDYKIITTFPGSTILIQCIPNCQPKRLYSITRNPGYTNLALFVQKNTCIDACKWARQVVIIEWLRCYNRSIRYECGAEPLSLLTAVQLIESSLQNSIIRTNNALDTASTCSTLRTQSEGARRKSRVMFTCRTRSTCAKIAKLVSSASRSRVKIEYTSDTHRHFPGQSPKLKRLPRLMFRICDNDVVDPWLIRTRTATVCELEGVHSALVHLNILSPRDQWETWIDNFKQDRDCDPAFMCLLVIIMSSSTADNQLAHIVPRLFSSGLTSPTAVIEVVEQYGLNCFCSLFSESGRYYQNAERVLNAADYFVQRHKGRIPSTISVHELCTLFGVGYKTANIVVTTAFRRVDGIPSDIHVIRWSSLLGWCPTNADGLQCSKLLECWLPKSKWESINPLFGAFGQLLVSEHRRQVLQISRQHPSLLIRNLFRKAAELYK
jgi:endonuclease III